MEQDWGTKAECRNAETELFFSHALNAGQAVRKKFSGQHHLEIRENFCGRCPVRRQCFEQIMTAEGGAGKLYRFGVYAGLTPDQRHSLMKRETWHCPKCNAVLDPFGFIEGWVACDSCDYEARVLPVPDTGDEWNARHTKLAERVVAALVEDVEVGAEAPAPTQMATALKARKEDVLRVYEALLVDKTLKRDGRKYIRKAPAAAMQHWVPPHLAA